MGPQPRQALVAAMILAFAIGGFLILLLIVQLITLMEW